MNVMNNYSEMGPHMISDDAEAMESARTAGPALEPLLKWGVDINMYHYLSYVHLQIDSKSVYDYKYV